jgi:flagellar basal body-associated protein FliL
MKAKTKKILFISILVVVVLATSYVTFIYAFVTHGFRDYVQFCSLYIEQIDDYKKQTGHYPDTLQQLSKPRLSFRYEASDCHYNSQTDIYDFSVKHSLIGQKFYYSDTNKWISD